MWNIFVCNLKREKKKTDPAGNAEEYRLSISICRFSRRRKIFQKWFAIFKIFQEKVGDFGDFSGKICAVVGSGGEIVDCPARWQADPL